MDALYTPVKTVSSDSESLEEYHFCSTVEKMSISDYSLEADRSLDQESIIPLVRRPKLVRRLKLVNSEELEEIENNLEFDPNYEPPSTSSYVSEEYTSDCDDELYQENDKTNLSELNEDNSNHSTMSDITVSKISELIAALQNILMSKGDLPITMVDETADGCNIPGMKLMVETDQIFNDQIRPNGAWTWRTECDDSDDEVEEPGVTILYIDKGS